MRRSLACAILLTLSSALTAAPYDEMDYGPFLSHTFQLPNNNITLRGIAVPFNAPLPGEDGKAGKCGVIFDTELLRYSGFWSGGFITWNGVVFNGNHGANPAPVGKVHFATKMLSGWSKDGKYEDPRPIPHGPMPRDWGRYKGLYRTDKGIVFSYTVGDASVLDMPGVEVHDKYRFFTRTINSNGKTDRFAILDLPALKPGLLPRAMSIQSNGQGSVAQHVDQDGNAVLVICRHALVRDKDGRCQAGLDGQTAKIIVWTGPAKDLPDASKAAGKIGPAIDLTPLTKGGKARFTETVTTQGKRGDDKSAYTVDSLTPPFKNPYKSWMRFGGFDFFSDGRAAVSTWSGDVWIVSGIDDKLEKLTWKRYAAGLFHALGLKIVDDKVYVLGRDQITRLHDTNGDGEADFYECFNNEAMITTNFHEFTFDLQTDPDGNFYFVKGGPVRPGGRGWDKVTPHHGCIFKVSSDGSKLEVVARGFRAPNGMGVGPHGEITVGDNEGTWTPTCPINWIKPGGFYGVPDFAGKPKAEFPKVRDNPLCWLPHGDVDNSNGGQAWITGKNFGPLSGQLMHSSYGKCRLYEVMKEEVAGQMQGGVVPIMIAPGKFDFDSGICRMRFNEKANALFITGLRGWQTTAQKDAGFYRLRYTGQKAYLPVDLKVQPGEIAITFSDPLAEKSAADPDNYSVRRWNYRWTENYGSAHYKVSNPKQQGQDEMEVESAALSKDGKTVTLRINDLKPCMQMKIQYNLKAADGTQVRNSIHHTINVVGNLRGEVHVGDYRIVEGK
jgi:hypothetical protein